MENYYWLLPDGKIWSSLDGGWISKEELPAGAVLTPMRDEEYLKKTIAFYGCDLGKLAGGNK